MSVSFGKVYFISQTVPHARAGKDTLTGTLYRVRATKASGGLPRGSWLDRYGHDLPGAIMHPSVALLRHPRKTS
jgi:hypothetical protein